MLRRPLPLHWGLVQSLAHPGVGIAAPASWAARVAGLPPVTTTSGRALVTVAALSTSGLVSLPKLPATIVRFLALGEAVEAQLIEKGNNRQRLHNREYESKQISTATSCAGAASGHTAAPPSPAMNSRRLMPTLAEADNFNDQNVSTSRTCCIGPFKAHGPWLPTLPVLGPKLTLLIFAAAGRRSLDSWPLMTKHRRVKRRESRLFRIKQTGGPKVENVGFQFFFPPPRIKYLTYLTYLSADR